MSMTKKIAILGLVLLVAVVVVLAPLAAAGKKKKKPKPWKSEEVTIAVAHPIFYGATGQVNAVTIQEFQHRCAEPASQGLDAWVFEIPKPYQKLDAAVEATGSSAGYLSYDLDVFFFDAECQLTLTSQAEGTDETAFMPKGTVWIGVHNYLGDPQTTAQVTIKP